MSSKKIDAVVAQARAVIAEQDHANDINARLQRGEAVTFNIGGGPSAIDGLRAALADLDAPWKPYPPGMQAESQRLHREYNALVAAQRNGARNGAEVVKLTDECNAKGIILVPGGENL